MKYIIVLSSLIILSGYIFMGLLISELTGKISTLQDSINQVNANIANESYTLSDNIKTLSDQMGSYTSNSAPSNYKCSGNATTNDMSNGQLYNLIMECNPQ